jgi:hypothetical protein
MPVWPCAAGAKRQAVFAMKRKSGGERVSVLIEAIKEKGRPAVTNLPFNIPALRQARESGACWSCP